MEKENVLKWLNEHEQEFTHMADQIWEFAEISHREFKSSRLQAEYLESRGFKITRELANLRTAFMAEWGSGKPVIGFAGEFDALDGLSQKRQPQKEPLQPGAPGHGCGHNLLGVGCLAAAVAVQEWLKNTGSTGTVRYYGCPAEENTYGKTFMARAGVFDDLDAAFNYHPSYYNSPSKATAVGVFDIRYRFHGRAAHAGGSPHLGRSALDAVELMNIGVNYLREHVTSNVRIHYAITHGGDLPNIVPPEAEVWYFIRALEPEEHREVAERVRKIAQGAALMTETTMEEVFRSACSRVINNHTLADLQYENMKLVGPIHFTEEELAFARQINQAYPAENRASLFKNIKLTPEWQEKIQEYAKCDLLGENFPPMDEDNVETGSTDVGDLSQITPLSMLGTACFPTGAAGHSWGIVAASGSSIGHKGMMHAAKVMALSAIDCYRDPQHIQKAREEFIKSMKGKPYQCPLPAHVQPPRYDE